MALLELDLLFDVFVEELLVDGLLSLPFLGIEALLDLVDTSFLPVLELFELQLVLLLVDASLFVGLLEESF